ncbi:hypothetical protein Pcinc_001752 [Petrolisthes cinctipes]|uniref:Uncharacterized protein n=1 Tax=Petrolisthes cinctipes TaxID=88211 RepID=A0AAE1GM85_PETCI|nr:hypothetical protein Pcinc_001752 [Petrolisthes cinctipes]
MIPSFLLSPPTPAPQDPSIPEDDPLPPISVPLVPPPTSPAAPAVSLGEGAASLEAGCFPSPDQAKVKDLASPYPSSPSPAGPSYLPFFSLIGRR